MPRLSSWARFLFLILAFTFVPLPAAVSADRFYVINGDTFVLEEQNVSAWGIDAPEKKPFCQKSDQNYLCGKTSRDYLRSLIKDPADLRCEIRPRAKKETRIVALCRVDGQDLGQLMVSAGWAVDYRFFSKGYYAQDDASARAAGRGIWAGGFEQPRDWRQRHPY